jgi:hypothetical protein
MREKCLEGKTLIHGSAVLGNGGHKLNFDWCYYSEVILQRFWHHFTVIWSKFYTLTIQSKNPINFKFNLVNYASGWLGGLRVAFLPDRILSGTVSETLCNVACGIS